MSKQAGGPLLIEKHPEGCRCSYCGNNGYDVGLHYGLNIPPAWRKSNSWWVVKYGPGRYLRWTNRFLRWFA